MYSSNFSTFKIT